jgi:hypothetical protein
MAELPVARHSAAQKGRFALPDAAKVYHWKKLAAQRPAASSALISVCAYTISHKCTTVRNAQNLLVQLRVGARPKRVRQPWCKCTSRCSLEIQPTTADCASLPSDRCARWSPCQTALAFRPARMSLLGHPETANVPWRRRRLPQRDEVSGLTSTSVHSMAGVATNNRDLRQPVARRGCECP